MMRLAKPIDILSPFASAGIPTSVLNAYIIRLKTNNTPRPLATIFEDVRSVEVFIKEHYPDSDFYTSSRKPMHVSARRALFWVLRLQFGLTYAEIGELYGKDHSTIIYAVRRFVEGFNEHPSDKIIKKIFADD